MNDISIIIIGWHFLNKKLFQDIVDEVNEGGYNAGLYIASHRSKKQIPKDLDRKLKKLGYKINYYQNSGWDWGAINQAALDLTKGGKQSKYYAFMHDDLEIKKHGFIKESIELINSGCQVVGNSRESNKPKDWSISHPLILAWAKLHGIEINISQWQWVRGSYLFTIGDITSTILTQLPYRISGDIRLGNWSEIVFAGMVAQKYGADSIQYLGKHVRKSNYILELERGQEITRLNVARLVKNLVPNNKKRKVTPIDLQIFGPESDLQRLLINTEGVNVDYKGPLLNANVTESSIEHIHLSLTTLKNLFTLEEIKRLASWLQQGGQCTIHYHPERLYNDFRTVFEKIVNKKNIRLDGKKI